MKRGFTFGKYLPFHQGHKALIDFALDHCDELIVLVCVSNSESISGEIRSGWIAETYERNPRVRVHTLEYDESILPNTSVSSKEISKLWAAQFRRILPEVDMLITSEPYGAYVSEFMGIRSISFDQERKYHPISASQLRDSLYDNWDFLPDAVKPYFQKKVVLLGTESTGKSTMARLICNSFNATLVDEVGRDIIPDSNDFTVDQLKLIAHAHAQNTHKATEQLKPLVVMDTDVHITQSYAKYKFGEYLELDDAVYEANKAHLYLYLSANAPYFQDGTRLDKQKRLALDHTHRETLNHFGVNYIEVDGTYQERESRVIQLIGEFYL